MSVLMTAKIKDAFARDIFHDENGRHILDQLWDLVEARTETFDEFRADFTDEQWVSMFAASPTGAIEVSFDIDEDVGLRLRRTNEVEATREDFAPRVAALQ